MHKQLAGGDGEGGGGGYTHDPHLPIIYTELGSDD